MKKRFPQKLIPKCTVEIFFQVYFFFNCFHIFIFFFFSVEETKRIEEFYEEKMFCHHCDDSLAGHRYVLRDDHPYCIKCYENVFANNCDECGKIIGIDSKVSVYLVGVFQETFL